MYKITNNIEQILQINNAQAQKEIGTTYCEVNKHCTKNLFAIPIIEPILRSYNLPFITNEWLNTDVVNDLPIDWTWDIMEKPFRLVCNSIELLKAIYSGDLSSTLITLLPDFKDQINTNNEHTYIYLATIGEWEGISVEWLLANYPNIFLFTEEKN